MEVKQLMMLWQKQSIKEYVMPAGFELRTYREGDAKGWIIACTDGLDTGAWREEDFYSKMLNADGIVHEGIFFIVDGRGEIAGTATGMIKPEPAHGYLHMVSVRPEFRGLGLGRILNTAVLKYLTEYGCTRVTLDTDDHRIPAIKSYLSAGFRPVLHSPDMVERWKSVMKNTGYKEINTFTEDDNTGPVITV